LSNNSSNLEIKNDEKPIIEDRGNLINKKLDVKNRKELSHDAFPLFAYCTDHFIGTLL
jgi:hypothetical protein